jgi:hypothetical protein
MAGMIVSLHERTSCHFLPDCSKDSPVSVVSSMAMRITMGPGAQPNRHLRLSLFDICRYRKSSHHSSPQRLLALQSDKLTSRPESGPLRPSHRTQAAISSHRAAGNKRGCWCEAKKPIVMKRSNTHWRHGSIRSSCPFLFPPIPASPVPLAAAQPNHCAGRRYSV